jgi:Domain of unknown function (DUF4360)
MSNTMLKSTFMFFFLSSLTAQAETAIEWSQANASGNGCPANTSMVTITPGGDEIAWTFDAFGFSLSGGAASANLFCKLSASARIKKGLYLAELKQELSYGGAKSKNGSFLSIGAQSRFLSYNLPAMTAVYDDGVVFNQVFDYVVSTQEVRIPDKVVSENFCKKDDAIGLYQSTLSAVGWTKAGGTASLSVQGQNVTFKATTIFVDCDTI